RRARYVKFRPAVSLPPPPPRPSDLPALPGSATSATSSAPPTASTASAPARAGSQGVRAVHPGGGEAVLRLRRPRVGQWLEVKDTVGKWYAAVITASAALRPTQLCSLSLTWLLQRRA